MPIASVMLADVDTYFDRLADYRDGDADGLTFYLAGAAVTASEEAEASATALGELPDRWRAAAGQPRKGSTAASVIDQLLASPVLTYKTAARLAATSDRSAFSALDRLTDAEILSEITGNRRDRVWIANDVFDELERLVDDDPTPGRFLLTGSTNFLAVPSISESLAGRARILRLWPLSEAELAGAYPNTVTRWFDGSVGTGADPGLSRADYLERLCRGGYPEVISLDPATRRAWFESYVETVTSRDLVALADIREVTALTGLLTWAAGSTSQEVNVSSAAGALGIDRSTVVSYLEWLEAVFLVHSIPAWSRNLTARATRRPKLHLTDTGLAADLLGLGQEALLSPTAPATGSLIETFTVNEIARQASAALDRVELSHYRDRRDHEVDLVLGRRDGTMVAIEVKATASPSSSQLRHVAWLRDKVDVAAPSAFRAGILLHAGAQSATVGDRLHLLPISSLWSVPG